MTLPPSRGSFQEVPRGDAEMVSPHVPIPRNPEGSVSSLRKFFKDHSLLIFHLLSLLQSRLHSQTIPVKITKDSHNQNAQTVPFLLHLNRTESWPGGACKHKPCHHDHLTLSCKPTFLPPHLKYFNIFSLSQHLSEMTSTQTHSSCDVHVTVVAESLLTAVTECHHRLGRRLKQQTLSITVLEAGSPRPKHQQTPHL